MQRLQEIIQFAPVMMKHLPWLTSLCSRLEYKLEESVGLLVTGEREQAGDSQGLVKASIRADNAPLSPLFDKYGVNELAGYGKTISEAMENLKLACQEEMRDDEIAKYLPVSSESDN